jgi:Tol biopolymer transport system component
MLVRFAFVGLALLLFFASGCSDESSVPPQPEPIDEIIVENGNKAASVWYIDSASLDGRILVRWGTGRAVWEPDDDWPPPPPPPAVGAVRLLVSRQGVDRGFSTAAFHDHDGVDSAWVDGLINGAAYYFRLATYDSTGSVLLGHSTPIMTMPGPPVDVERVVLSGLVPMWLVTSTWSPDGGRIAFVRPTLQPPNHAGGNICVLDLASGVELRLSAHEDEDRVLADVAWSPDGSRIAYSYSPTDMAGRLDYRIWLTPSGAFAPEAITAGRIDFGGEDLHSLRQNLYTLDPVGGGPMAATSSPCWSDTEPVWARGGNRVFMSSDRSGHFEIWSLDLDAGVWRQITRGSETRVERSGPEVSPDGMHLAFRQIVGYGVRGSLLIARLAEPVGS